VSEQTQPAEQPPAPREEPSMGIPSMLEQMRGPKPTISEIYLLTTQQILAEERAYRRWKEEQEEKKREWEREREELKKRYTEELAKIIASQLEPLKNTVEKLTATLSNIGTEKKGEKDEKDELIEGLKKQIEEINRKLSASEQEKREKEIIEKAQAPLLKEIELQKAENKRLMEQLANLQSTIKEMEKGKETSPTPTSNLKMVKETLQDVKETAKLMGLKEPSETSSSSPSSMFEGIPLEGGIPAWAAAIPIVIEKIMRSIEERAAKFGLVAPPTPEEPVLKLPSKPTPTPPSPMPAPTLPPQPEEKLIKLPPPPKEETEGVVIPLKAEPPQVKVEVKPPKTYKCKKCGATFDKPIKLAQHARKCKKEEKPKEEKASEPKTEGTAG